MQLTKLTIKQAREGLRKRDFSAIELTKACFDQIEKLNPKLNAFLTVTVSEALKEAKGVDKLFAKNETLPPLAGIPVAIKDIICTKGIRTTAGSKILENFIPPYDASVIKKLKEQHAIILGKTNLDEFAMGASTENSAYGPTYNPWDTARVPGGSSGGSAAAVAADMCIYALGSDTGGSVRQPASFCGATGLKPTYGRVSRYGLIAMTSSMDQIGPITKSTEDAGIVLSAIAGWDKYDSTSVLPHIAPAFTLPPLQQNTPNPLKSLKIGVPKEYFIEGMEKGVEETVRAAIGKLEEVGAKAIPISLPNTKYALPTYYIIVPSEISANLARYDGVRFGMKTQSAKGKVQNLIEEYLETRARFLGDEVKRRIMLGTYTLSAGYYEAYYLKASQVRALIKRDFDQAFEKVDVIVTPTSPTTAFKIGEKQDPLSMYLADIFTVPANLAGICGINIPCGFSEGLPVGLQILGPQFAEEKILQVAHSFEQQFTLNFQ